MRRMTKMNDMVPRITVRDHDDLHMLIALMRDAVSNLDTLSPEDRKPAREGAMDPLMQARTMLQNLEEMHTRFIMDQYELPIQEMAEFFSGLGVSVVVIDL